jgi:hypothetical protein
VAARAGLPAPPRAAPGRPGAVPAARYAATGHPLGYEHVGKGAGGVTLAVHPLATSAASVAARAIVTGQTHHHDIGMDQHLVASPNGVVTYHRPERIGGLAWMARPFLRPEHDHNIAVAAGNVLGRFHIHPEALPFLRAIDEAHSVGARSFRDPQTPGWLPLEAPGGPPGRLPGDERRRSVWCAGLRLRGGGYRRRCFWSKSLQSCFPAGRLTLWSRGRGPGAFIWERPVEAAVAGRYHPAGHTTYSGSPHPCHRVSPPWSPPRCCWSAAARPPPALVRSRRCPPRPKM